MRALIGCETSQAVALALRARGVESYSCDLLPCLGGRPDLHYQDDIFYVLKHERFDLLIAHPPCTYLTAAAARWLMDQPARVSGVLVGAPRRAAQAEAVAFVRKLWAAPVALKCLENPVGALSTLWQKPTQIIHPWQYGHAEQKNYLPLAARAASPEAYQHRTRRNDVIAS